MSVLQGCGWLQDQVNLLCVVCSILLCLWALHLRANQSIILAVRCMRSPLYL